MFWMQPWVRVDLCRLLVEECAVRTRMFMHARTHARTYTHAHVYTHT